MPPTAHVEKLQTLRLVLRGDSVSSARSVSCESRGAGRSASYIELDEDTTANVVLAPMTGTAALHVTHLGTQKTWCAMTQSDGTGARIPANFESGVYAIEVESSLPRKQAYAVTFERL